MFYASDRGFWVSKSKCIQSQAGLKTGMALNWMLQFGIWFNLLSHSLMLPLHIKIPILTICLIDTRNAYHNLIYSLSCEILFSEIGHERKRHRMHVLHGSLWTGCRFPAGRVFHYDAREFFWHGSHTSRHLSWSSKVDRRLVVWIRPAGHPPHPGELLFVSSSPTDIIW